MVVIDQQNEHICIVTYHPNTWCSGIGKFGDLLNDDHVCLMGSPEVSQFSLRSMQHFDWRWIFACDDEFLVQRLLLGDTD